MCSMVSFCPFSVDHCIVCPSLNYGFWLPHCIVCPSLNYGFWLPHCIVCPYLNYGFWLPHCIVCPSLNYGFWLPHCIVCPSLNYSFWLPYWYLLTFYSNHLSYIHTSIHLSQFCLPFRSTWVHPRFLVGFVLLDI